MPSAEGPTGPRRGLPGLAHHPELLHADRKVAPIENNDTYTWPHADAWLQRIEKRSDRPDILTVARTLAQHANERGLSSPGMGGAAYGITDGDNLGKRASFALGQLGSRRYAAIELHSAGNARNRIANTWRLKQAI